MTSWSSYTAGDTHLQQLVLEELDWDKRVCTRDIAVSVKDGIVTLAGTVDSYTRRLAAQEATLNVLGVKAVVNELEVRPPSTAEDTDAELARDVLSALAWDAEIPSQTLDVVVSHGWVTLQGTVEVPFQRHEAERLVYHLPGVPLDIMVVRKLGVPGARELAMGALAFGGIRLQNTQVVAAYRIPADAYQAVVDREERELERSERLYRGDAPALDVRDRTVILVDDGIATGSTVRAALAELRLRPPARVIVATPVAAAETADVLRAECDELVSLLVPEEFFSVGTWYDEFAEISDDEIRALLDRQAMTLGGWRTRESNVPAPEEPSSHEELGR